MSRDLALPCGDYIELDLPEVLTVWRSRTSPLSKPLHLRYWTSVVNHLHQVIKHTFLSRYDLSILLPQSYLFEGKGPSSSIPSAEPSEISLHSCILRSIDRNLRTRLDAFDITVRLEQSTYSFQIDTPILSCSSVHPSPLETEGCNATLLHTNCCHMKRSERLISAHPSYVYPYRSEGEHYSFLHNAKFSISDKQLTLSPQSHLSVSYIPHFLSLQLGTKWRITRYDVSYFSFAHVHAKYILSDKVKWKRRENRDGEERYQLCKIEAIAIQM